MFQEKMVTPAIPERVYALCKIVEKKAISNNELKAKMQPAVLNNTSDYFGDYRKAAEELGLISISDNTVSLAVSPDVIRTIDDMRVFINGRLELFSNGQFYQVTKEIFNMNESVFNNDNNVASWGPMLSEKLNRSIDAVNMRAWRFWSSFLGFGYLQDMFFIPNADVFLQDLIGTSGLEKEKLYTFSDFIDCLRPKCNIIIDDKPSSRNLNYGVSCGLRTLHDKGIIQLQHIRDWEELWDLYPMQAHDISGTVTHVTIY